MNESASAHAVLTRVAASSLRQHTAENFPVALRLLPRTPRDALLRVYAYARFVDDVGDEAPGDRLALLDLVEADVRGLPAGRATLAPVAGLAPLIDTYDVPIETLLDLVRANRIDQDVTRYRTFDDLLGYCRLSAAPVGRVVLAVAGAAGPQEVAFSDVICAGLQVLEHCQDVAEDARAGRVYLPADDLADLGVEDADLRADSASPALRRVVARQVDRAQALLDEGRPLLRRLHGWARVAVTGYLAGGHATAAAIRDARHDVLPCGPRPTKVRTLTAAVRLATRR